MWLIGSFRPSFRPISQIEDEALVSVLAALVCISSFSADTVTMRITSLFNDCQKARALFFTSWQLALQFRSTAAIAFTCDGWTALQRKWFLDITAYWLTEDCFMNSAVLRVVRMTEHDREAFAKVLFAAFDVWHNGQSFPLESTRAPHWSAAANGDN